MVSPMSIDPPPPEAQGPGAATPYGLPPLPQLPCPEFRGPTPWSNWVIKGRLLAGAYPASLDDAETERILTTLLELGVNTFVCLQAEFSLHTPESAWRAGQGLRPYIKDAQRLLVRAREAKSQRIKQEKLDFLHLPIIDGSVTHDTALSRLADDCCMRLLRGERLYVHCWGGHGRTGTLIAVMLARLYGLTCGVALRFTQAFHDSRKFPQGVRSPQTTPQVAQVKRLLPDPPSVRHVAYPKDPLVVLNDGILRLPPASPAARAATALVPPPIAAAAAAAADADLMEVVEEAQLLPEVPLNQQRKEAIRAKQAGGITGVARSTGDSAHPAPTSAEGIAAALQAASLDGRSVPVPVPGSIRAAPTSGAPRASSAQWLASMFGKQARRPEAGDAGGLLAAGHPAPSYLQHHLQRQQPPPPSTDSSSKAALGGSGRPTFHLTASSGSAAGVGDHLTPVDMRPSVTVVAPPDAAERSAASVPSRSLMGYLSGRPSSR